MSNETQRMSELNLGDRIESPSILVSAKAVHTAECLGKVKEVLKLIAAESINGTWPNDDEWLDQLPSWFTQPFQDRTIEQVLADESLWDYGSWLDAMRHRGWQWWSSSTDDDEIKITLQREDDVYSIEPLVYLVRQCGASSVQVTESFPPA